MTRPDIHTLSGAYALDALPSDERTEFEAHLDNCEPCAEEVAELQATAARLGETLHQPPPADLKGRVLAEIDRTRQEPPDAGDRARDAGDRREPDEGVADVVAADRAESGWPDPEPDQRLRDDAGPPAVPPPVPPAAGPRDAGSTSGTTAGSEPTDLAAARRTKRTARPAGAGGAPRWLLGTVAAAAGVLAIAVVGLGFAVASLGERLEEMEAAAGQMSGVLTAVDAETVSVAADGTVVRIVMSPGRGEAVVLVDGMAPAPEDHAYELWLIHDDVRVPAGVFDVDERGRATRVVTGDMATVTAVGVTVEPAGGSPQPTSDPVMLVEVAG